MHAPDDVIVAGVRSIASTSRRMANRSRSNARSNAAWAIFFSDLDQVKSIARFTVSGHSSDSCQSSNSHRRRSFPSHLKWNWIWQPRVVLSRFPAPPRNPTGSKRFFSTTVESALSQLSSSVA